MHWIYREAIGDILCLETGMSISICEFTSGPEKYYIGFKLCHEGT